MSKNFKNPQAFLHNVQLDEQVEQEEFNLTPGVYPTNGNGSPHGPYRANGNGSLPAAYPTNGNSARPETYPDNGKGSLPGVYPTNGNGSLQFSAPISPFTNVPTIPLHSTQSAAKDSHNGVGAAPFKVPTTPSHNGLVTTTVGVPFTPFPGFQPAIVDPRKSDRVERYAQWLQVNNNLTASPQKLQAYQDAALEIKKIGKREVRTFAPFQEHTSALQVITSDQLTILAMLAIYWMVGLFLLHLAMLTITIGIITLLYICGFITSAILATRSFNGSSGEKIDEEIIVALDQLGVEWPTYTVLCPLFRERDIVPQFVEAMKALNYPMHKLQVLFLTEENDHETRTALYSMQLPPDFTVLTVPEGSPQTKPRACNFGLLQTKRPIHCDFRCRG